VSYGDGEPAELAESAGWVSYGDGEPAELAESAGWVSTEPAGVIRACEIATVAFVRSMRARRWARVGRGGAGHR